jgi:hypothetical protein
MDLTSEGFAIDAELFARAKAAGLRWIELEVEPRPRVAGKSKVGPHTARAALADLRRLRREL